MFLKSVTQKDYEVDLLTLFFLSFAYGIISFLSVFGNILIILAIRHKRMHNVTNYFILNLALADIVIGLFATPFQVEFRFIKYKFSKNKRDLFFSSFKLLFYNAGYFLK
jgi:hypothetical protein